MDERRSGGSYLSQNDARLHFGFEQRAKIDALEVRWPSGLTETFANVPVNGFISIREGDNAWHPYRCRNDGEGLIVIVPPRGGCATRA